MKTVPAAELRARNRRRAIRQLRRSSVDALLRLGARTGGKPGHAIRATAHRLERAMKRAEQVVAPHRPRAPAVGRAWDAAKAEREYATLASALAHRLVRVEQPLVLITQAPRSGGTLLMQLFDGHPQCHAVPHELATMLPATLPLPRDADRAWKVLHHEMLETWFVGGLRAGKGQLSDDRARYRFVLPPLLQQRLFEHAFGKPASDRAVLEAYLTSYFSAWLDHRPATDPKWVTGFEPSAILQPNRLSAFADLYPDGKLVSVVREPASWAVSAARRNARYADRAVAIATWRESVEAALRLDAAIVPFEVLVGATERTMRALAGFLAIEFTDELLVPTFNGRATKANSSFPVEQTGLIEAPLSRRDELPEEDRATIDRELGELHARALEAAVVK